MCLRVQGDERAPGGQGSTGIQLAEAALPQTFYRGGKRVPSFKCQGNLEVPIQTTGQSGKQYMALWCLESLGTVWQVTQVMPDPD